MAPILQPQNAQDNFQKPPSSGSKFTIIFVLIIVAVLLFCIWWGCILPKWRQKHPARPSSTRFNGLGGAAKYIRSPSSSQSQQLNLQRPERVFPSHPAVMHHETIPPAQEGIKIYNPRTQTPFPNSPPLGDSLSIPSITPRPSTSHGNLKSVSDSKGLFSPVKTVKLVREDSNTSGTVKEMVDYTPSSYGDAKDYILAIPEPLLLKPKSAGRPPPLTKQLERFPIPATSCRPITEKLAHPNKLFAELDKMRRTSVVVKDTKQQLKRAHTEPNTLPEVNLICSKVVQTRNYGDARQQLKFAQARSFKSARVFTNASTSRVIRAGTVTRPKTPVADIRDLYDRAAAEVASQSFQPSVLKRNLTPSTEPLTSSPAPFSTVPRSTTPPTSSISEEKHLSMLPTPLRLRRGVPYDMAESPSLDLPRWRSYTPSSVALPESPDKLGPLRQTLRSRHQGRRSIGFYHRNPSKIKPARFNLPSHFRSQSPNKNGEKRASMASLLSPFVFSQSVSRRSLAQGSSRYSKDTKGISIASTPTSLAFSTPTQLNFASMGEKVVRRPSSFDLVRSKIDDWNLHTADLHLERPPSSILPIKRTLSDLGPRSPELPDLANNIFHLVGTSVGNVATVNLGTTAPRVCVGWGSDDIFNDASDQENNCKKSPCTRRDPSKSAFSTSDSNLSSVMGKMAPGNAEWI